MKYTAEDLQRAFDRGYNSQKWQKECPFYDADLQHAWVVGKLQRQDDNKKAKSTG